MDYKDEDSNHNESSDQAVDVSEPRIMKCNRPRVVAFKQQKLKAWQPIITPGFVIPVFIGIGIIFIVIGALFYTEDQKVKTASVDYTSAGNCSTCDTNTYTSTSSGIATFDDFSVHKNFSSCICTVPITLDEDWSGSSIYLYYELSNYYQNSRRYARSRDDKALYGQDPTSSSTSNCDDLGTVSISGTTYTYAPCGYIANSLFNDTITLLKPDDSEVPINANDISWWSDRDHKFNNPSSGFNNYQHPVNWPYNVTDMPTANVAGDAYKNQDLINWMRVGALSQFKKLYRKLGTTSLTKGTYTFVIAYHYPVTKFGGSKKLYLSTTSYLGGKNSLLGILYLVVGCLTVVTGIGFLVLHLMKPRSIGQFRTN